MNIALSFGHSNKEDSIWDNDVKQNTLYLYLLLNKLSNVNVYLINFGQHVNSLSKRSRKELSGIKLYNWLMIKDKVKFDIFIESGLKLKEDFVNELKNKNIKYVLYNNYNKYLMDIEDILFNPNNTDILYEEYDEIWTLQSFQNMNKYYFEEVYKTKVYNLPNIWSNHFIDNEIEQLKKENIDYHYNDNELKNIVIFQKNDNVNNTSIYPLLIIEKTYNKDKNLFKNKIKNVILTNTNNILTNKKFISIIKKLNIYKDKYLIFKSNENIIDTISKDTDIIVSHHWDNSIDNYFYSLLYGNYPILHNSDNFKMNGYYYPDFNIQFASEKLEYIIINHDKLSLKYSNKSLGILNNYDINNKNIQEEYYRKLLDLKKK